MVRSNGWGTPSTLEEERLNEEEEEKVEEEEAGKKRITKDIEVGRKLQHHHGRLIRRISTHGIGGINK